MTPHTRHRVLVAVADLEQEAQPRRRATIRSRVRLSFRVVTMTLRELDDEGLVTCAHPCGWRSTMGCEWTVTAEGWRRAREVGA